MSVYASSSSLGHELVCNLLGDTRGKNLVYILIAPRKGSMRYIINESDVR
jgi:hypothetical protein